MEIERALEHHEILNSPPTEVRIDDFETLDFRWKRFHGFTDLLAALKLRPEDPVLAYQLGMHLAREKKYEHAERVLRSLLKRENGFEVLEAEATCLYHCGRWGECAHMARQALMLGEGFRDQRFQLLKFLGNSLIQLRDLDGAQEAFEKAFVLFPGSDVLQVNFGALWVQKSDWNQATECFRHAIFLNDGNDRAWTGLALCHRIRGDFELAFGNLERALDIDPLNETALSLLLDWCSEREDFARAVVRFTAFTDAGGFQPSLSKLFICKSRWFGETTLADIEDFHLQLRGDAEHV